jgi:hypothetical protein
MKRAENWRMQKNWIFDDYLLANLIQQIPGIEIT